MMNQGLVSRGGSPSSVARLRRSLPLGHKESLIKQERGSPRAYIACLQSFSRVLFPERRFELGVLLPHLLRLPLPPHPCAAFDCGWFCDLDSRTEQALRSEESAKGRALSEPPTSQRDNRVLRPAEDWGVLRHPYPALLQIGLCGRPQLRELSVLQD